jgi:hypothetical protein
VPHDGNTHDGNKDVRVALIVALVALLTAAWVFLLGYLAVRLFDAIF